MAHMIHARLSSSGRRCQHGHGRDDRGGEGRGLLVQNWKDGGEKDRRGRRVGIVAEFECGQVCREVLARYMSMNIDAGQVI